LARSRAPERELSALRSAIELQLGFEIFSTVDRTKCALSVEQLSLFSFHRAAVDIDRMAARRRFELAIAPLLTRVDGALDAVLERSGIGAPAIAEIVCTGGSSAIPAARALLARRFPAALIRDAAPHTTVAAGLATSAIG